LRRLRILDTARRDIAQIYAYVERQSASASIAERFVRQINEQCRRLARLPGTLGRMRPELRPDLRSAPFRGYIIFFRYLADDILEVVHIIERHRDIDGIFARDEDE
jgi:plasmid stabilization system protein ParE